MQHEVWARLTSPFPSEALAWIVAELEPGGGRARLEPAWAPGAVRQRLDAQLGLEGWSFSLTGAGPAGVACALTIGATTRSAVANGVGGSPSLEVLADLAFARCARQFGLAPAVALEHESYWVDHDPETGEPLYVPEVALGGAPAQEAAPTAPAEEQGAPSQTTEDRSDGLALIEKLVDRLKAEGLGKEAARLVAQFHGGSPEQSRELYGRLRALLKQEVSA